LGRTTVVSVCAHPLTAQARISKATRTSRDDIVGLRLLISFPAATLLETSSLRPRGFARRDATRADIALNHTAKGALVRSLYHVISEQNY
jgi:hypothetical protein